MTTKSEEHSIGRRLIPDDKPVCVHLLKFSFSFGQTRSDPALGVRSYRVQALPAAGSLRSVWDTLCSSASKPARHPSGHAALDVLLQHLWTEKHEVPQEEMTSTSSGFLKTEFPISRLAPPNCPFRKTYRRFDILGTVGALCRFYKSAEGELHFSQMIFFLFFQKSVRLSGKSADITFLFLGIPPNQTVLM